MWELCHEIFVVEDKRVYLPKLAISKMHARLALDGVIIDSDWFVWYTSQWYAETLECFQSYEEADMQRQSNDKVYPDF